MYIRLRRKYQLNPTFSPAFKDSVRWTGKENPGNEYIGIQDDSHLRPSALAIAPGYPPGLCDEVVKLLEGGWRDRLHLTRGDRTDEISEREVVFYERMYVMEENLQLFDSLYAAFLRERLGNVWGERMKQIEEWLATD